MPNFGGGELKISCASVQVASAAPAAAAVILVGSAALPLPELENSLWSAGGMPGMPNFGGGAGGMPDFGGMGGMPGGMNFEDLGEEGEGAGECMAALLHWLWGLTCMKAGCRSGALCLESQICCGSVLLYGAVRW